METVRESYLKKLAKIEKGKGKAYSSLEEMLNEYAESSKASDDDISELAGMIKKGIAKKHEKRQL